MKKFFALMSLVLGAIAFTGCTNSNIEESPVKEGNFSFTVTMDAMTRATVEKNNVVFTPGDKVAFGAAEHATNDTVTKAMIAEYSANDGKFYCDTVLDETKSFDFYALWPYQAGSKGASFNLPAKLKNPNQYSTYVYVGKNAFGQIAQNVDSATQYAPMIGVSTVGSPAAGASVNLHHLASMLEFEVKNATSAPVKFSSLKMTVGNGTKFCGTYYVDMTTGALSPSGDNYVYDNCTVSIEGNSDEVAAGSTWKFFMPVAPVTLAAGTEITFDITASDGTLCRVVKHIPATASVTFEAGKWNTQSLDYTGASTITYDTIADILSGENGSYEVHGALIYAKSGKNFIIGDNTGFMLMYSSNTLNVGDVIDVNGNVVVYNGVKEFSNPTTTSTGTATVYYPTPVAFNYSSYISSPFVGYIDASGVLSAKNLTKDSENYYIYVNTGVDTTGLTGKDVVCQGFAFGYHQTNKTVSYIITSISEDSSIPSLTLDHETIHFDADDWGASGSTKTVHATVLNTELTDLTYDATWCLAERSGNTLYITALEQNTTGSTRTATVTVNTEAGISKTITVTQASATGATIAAIYQAGPGTYSLTGVTVYAVNSNANGPQNVIIGDATGFMLVYQPTFTGADNLTAGQIVDINGPVTKYEGNNAIVYEFCKTETTPLQMTVTGTASSFAYPTPVTLTHAQYAALIDKTKVLPIQYIAVTGVNSSAGVTTADDDVYNTANCENVNFEGMDDKKVNLTGFTFGVTQSTTTPKVKVLVTSVEVDATAPSLTVSPTSLSFDATDAGSSKAKEITCTVENTTLTTAVASESWLTATVNGTTVSVYPSANTSTSARTATVTINTAAGLSKTVNVSQSGASSGDGLTVTYSFTAASDYPSGFPTKTGTAATTATTFTFNGSNQLSLYAPNAYYMIANSGVYSLFFGKSSSTFSSSAYLEIPGKSGYTITKITITNGSNCAADVAVNIFDASGNAKSTAVNTQKSSIMEFNVSGAAANTAYRISSLTKGKNFQFDKIVVTYSK